MIMKRTVSRIALLGVLLVISGVWFSRASAAASEPLEVRWSYRLTPQNIIFIDGKYPQRYGVTVKPILFKTGIEARDGLIAGAIDVGELGVTPAITALARSQKDLAIVAVSSFGGGKYRVVVPKNSPIKHMEELRGKKLAIKVGSGNYTAFLMWAKAKGYDIKDFQINDVGDTEAMSAMEAGSVEAVIYWEPIPAILVAKGIAREIFNFDGFVQNPVYLVARRDWLKKSPQAATHLLAAWIEAQEFIQHNVPEAAKISAEALTKRGINISAEAYKLALGHEYYEPWLYPMLIKETLETYQFLVKDGKTPANIDWKTAFEASYLGEAQKLVVQQNAAKLK